MADRKVRLRADIEAAHDALRAKADGLSAAQWQAPSPNEGWSAKDVLAHLSSIEERMRTSVRSALGEAPWPTETIDAFNDRKVAERRRWSVQELRAELDREALATLKLLDSLPAEHLERRCEHPRRGSITIEDVWRIIPNHIHSHLPELTPG